MHARGPPKKVNMLPHTPGVPLAAGGTEFHLDGLCSNMGVDNIAKTDVRQLT